jgi:hypothetical protein
MKLVREHINEKFKEEGDPIRDMGIGLKHKINEWIDQNKYMFKDFDLVNNRRLGGSEVPRADITINSDMEIDVKGGWLDFSAEREPFPEYIKFGTIQGDFSCSSVNFPFDRLPKRVTHRLKYFVPNIAINVGKYQSEIIKYCDALYISVDID